jgi:predicted phosphoribosyltransferase
VTFLDLADGGRALAPLVEALRTPGTVVVSAGVGGLVTGAAVADALGIQVTPLATTRSESGVSVEIPVDVSGLRVIVVDDGVETGTAARAVGAALREAGARYIVLAVPVCPREAEADLRSRFDEIVAVERPLVRRSLRWHYENFA